MITKTEKIVIFICCVVLVVRGVLLWNGNFPFSWDFARDALWVRQLTIQHKALGDHWTTPSLVRYIFTSSPYFYSCLMGIHGARCLW